MFPHIYGRLPVGAVVSVAAVERGAYGAVTLPHSPAEYDQFLHGNKIRYFVYRSSLAPLNAERLGEGSNNPRHAEMAYDLMRYLLPGSRLILTDSFGWELREIAADKLE